MTQNFVRKFIFCFIILTLANCRGGGFYEPITMSMDIPDGSLAFKAGWRAGCQSALATKGFANAFVYKQNYGNGIYQHDPDFSRAWGRAWFACILHINNFVNTASPMRHAPLE